MIRPKPVPETITLHVPFRVVKRGGRKEMVIPNTKIGPTNGELVDALGQAFHWKRLLDKGEIATLSDLASRAKVAPSWVSRMMRLTMLSPKAIEAILNGDHGEELSVSSLTNSLPLEWEHQEENLGLHFGEKSTK